MGPFRPCSSNERTEELPFELPFPSRACAFPAWNIKRNCSDKLESRESTNGCATHSLIAPFGTREISSDHVSFTELRRFEQVSTQTPQVPIRPGRTGG